MLPVGSMAIFLPRVCVEAKLGRHVGERTLSRRGRMTDELLMSLYIFALAGFVGHYVIESVPPLLHTPLMAGTNAISGISLVGSLVVAGSEYSTLATILGTIAVMCASINTVGGFLITDRMLKMFKSKESKPGAKKS
jgi:H+-translocating NAD(P) transhydrogenase subunit alpha